jgi:hypothetical protein
LDGTVALTVAGINEVSRASTAPTASEVRFISFPSDALLLLAPRTIGDDDMAQERPRQGPVARYSLGEHAAGRHPVHAGEVIAGVAVRN